MQKASPKTSERLTRNELIDKRVTDAGWRIVRQKDFNPSKPLKTYDRCATCALISESLTVTSHPADGNITLSASKNVSSCVSLATTLAREVSQTRAVLSPGSLNTLSPVAEI